MDCSSQEINETSEVNDSSANLYNSFIDGNKFKKIIFLVKKKKKNCMDQNWSQEEDTLLVELIQRIGLKWRFLEKYFPDKTKNDIYKRFYRINPKVKKGKFSSEEDQQLVELIKINGFNWAKISKIIRNRTAKQIRSRYFNGLFKYFEENEKKADISQS